jgi:hypothetical protein
MKNDDEDLGWKFKQYIQSASLLTNRYLEHLELLKNSTPNTPENRIQTEVFFNIQKELIKKMEMIYSVILSYNLDPLRFPSLTQGDILKAQLLLDEVTNRIKKTGGGVSFTRKQ